MQSLKGEPMSNLLTSVGLEHYLVLSILLFSIGMLGFFFQKSIIMLLVCLELMLNAVNLSFVAFSHFSNNISGQVMVFFVMSIAAAEVGVGLAIAVLFFKKKKSFDISEVEKIKG